LGVPQIDASVHVVVAERIRQEFQRQNRKAAIAIYELAPIQATKARRTGFFRVSGVSRRAWMMTPRELLTAVVRSPSEGSELLTFAVRGGQPSGLTTSMIANSIFNGPQPRWWPMAPSAQKPTLEMRQNEYRKRLFDVAVRNLGGPPPAWNVAARGETRVVYPETEELYEEYLTLMREPTTIAADQKWRIETCDLIELRFDEGFVRDTIETVRRLRASATQTFVLLPPRNVRWTEPSAAGNDRLKSFLARIEQETGVQVIDMSRAAEVQSDFLDTVHLNETAGRPKFSRLFARELAARIGVSSASTP
jgi:hypothetical protein